MFRESYQITLFRHSCINYRSSYWSNLFRLLPIFPCVKFLPPLLFFLYLFCFRNLFLCLSLPILLTLFQSLGISLSIVLLIPFFSFVDCFLFPSILFFKECNFSLVVVQLYMLLPNRIGIVDKFSFFSVKWNWNVLEVFLCFNSITWIVT